MAVAYISLQLFNEDSIKMNSGIKVIELNERYNIVCKNEVSNPLVKELQRAAGTQVWPVAW